MPWKKHYLCSSKNFYLRKKAKAPLRKIWSRPCLMALQNRDKLDNINLTLTKGWAGKLSEGGKMNLVLHPRKATLKIRCKARSWLSLQIKLNKFSEKVTLKKTRRCQRLPKSTIWNHVIIIFSFLYNTLCTMSSIICKKFKLANLGSRTKLMQKWPICLSKSAKYITAAATYLINIKMLFSKLSHCFAQTFSLDNDQLIFCHCFLHKGFCTFVII